MGDPMGEGVGLSGSAPAMRSRGGAASPPAAPCSSLLRIEGFEVGGCRLHLGRPFMVGIDDGR
jgi:hypothetical protein